MSLGRADIEAMADDVFELGSAARYTPAAGGPVDDVRACPRVVDVSALDSFGLPTQQTGRVIELLKSELSRGRPGFGDTIEILPGGMALAGIYRVLEDASSEDRYQLVWRCRVSDPQ